MKIKKAIALMVGLVLIVSLALPGTLAVSTDQSAANSTLTLAGDTELKVSPETVALEKSREGKLTADAGTLTGTYQWQIQVSDGAWVNILGANEKTLTVTYGLVASLLLNDAARIRCHMTPDTGKALDSNVVTVQIQPDAAAAKAPAASPAIGTVTMEAKALGDPVIVPAQTPAPAADQTPADESVQEDAVAPANDTVEGDESAQPEATPQDDENNDTPTQTTYSIIINYVFTDGKQAAPSWTATVATGSTYTQDVESPVVVGYEPNEKTVHVEASEARTYTVTYYPTTVKFTVKHYQQNVSNDEYTLVNTETKEGITEKEVGSGLEDKFDGFYSLIYDATTKVAADGSTVVEIYYDRYYYLLTLDLDGGYGAEPVYARYGTPISVADPTKPGFTFGGWSPAKPETMPAGNRTIKAQWLAGNATYLVQYWLENANDDGYSYDSSVQKSASAGSTVSGSNDKSYTGFHYDHADQSVTVNGDGTTVVNVYYKRNTYTLTFKVNEGSSWYPNWVTKKEFKNVKYGEDTSKYWSQAPSGYLWYTSQNGNTFYTAAPDMPNNDLTIYGKSSSGSSTIHYYEDGTTTKIRDDLNVQSRNWSLTEEDYIGIPGFTYKSSSRSGSTYTLYYTRNSYKLDFNNRGKIVKSDTVPYEKSLTSYNFTPAYPEGLEADAYKFDGWYIDPGFTAAVDWATAKMPYKNTVLYAKWTPITHTVKTYLTEDNVGGTPLNTWENVAHRSTIEKPADPTNGGYEFVGWFYRDNGVEKAFDFSMPVTRDLDLYAKWSSNKLVAYTIKYAVKNADGTLTYIADDTTGSALAGTTKTFNAKTGTELYENYQSGYFPEVSSHSLTLDIENAENNVFTFIYVPKDKVPYVVRYLEKGTGNVLHDPKEVDTTDAVVTETFMAIRGYAPDAYQKQLVLAADGNEIIFWYTKDDVHAPVQVIHWTQNIAGDGYTQYQSTTDLNGVINDTYSEDPLTIAGFEYVKGSAVSGTKTAEVTAPTKPEGTLTADGLVLNLYYDRIDYPYEFRFLEQGTDKVLAEPVTGKGRYQARVTGQAESIPGYTLVGSNNQFIDIAIEDGTTAVKNVRIFYYTEQTVEIKYEVVGPNGCGTLDNYQESQLKVINGEVKGSTPTATDGFKFVGWFKDKECTDPVDEAWVTNNKLTPGKTKDYGTEAAPVMGYEGATYYAKFEYDVADLTITKSGWKDIDENQSFIFKVVGPDNFEKTVVIYKGGSVTIKGLKIGTYTVTEVTNWSWRYTPKDGKVTQTITLQPTGNEVKFENTRAKDKWLGGDAYKPNIFGNSN